MKSVNKIILLGNVAKDPEVKTIQMGSENVKVVRFSVATSTGGYTKKDGTPVKEETQFHRVTAWRGLAEIVETLIHKGDTVYVEGSVKYTEVEKDGKKERFTDIVAEEVNLCRKKDAQDPQPQQQAPQYQAPQPQYPPQPNYPPQYAPQYPPQYQQQFQPPFYPQGSTGNPPY